MSITLTAEGPGSVSGAPNLAAGVAETFTSRYIETGEIRQHVVIGGDDRHGCWCTCAVPSRSIASGTAWPRNAERAKRPLTMPVLGIGGETSAGASVGTAMKSLANDVQTAVIAGAGHWFAEEAPEETVAALAAFLAPYRDGWATSDTRKPHAGAVR